MIVAGARECTSSCLDAADALTGADQAIEVAVARGLLRHAAGDVAGAEAAFRQAIRLLDLNDLSTDRIRSSVQARHALGRLCRLQGHYDAAEDHLRDAFELARWASPRSVETSPLRGSGDGSTTQV